MNLLIYMRDGRTVYRLRGRGQLARLMSRDPWHEEQGVTVDRGTWIPDAGEYVWTSGVRLRFLSKTSISAVEEGRYATSEVAA